jgi:hypothetical protein
MKLKLFHDAKAPLANGHKRDSLLMMSDEEFESNHGFIQWAFPTAEKSNHSYNAPVSVVRVLVPKAASQRESLAHLIG